MNEIDNKKGILAEKRRIVSLIPWLVTASNMKEFVLFLFSIQLDVGDHQHLRSPTIVKFISNRMSEGGRFSNFVRKHLKQTSFKTKREKNIKVYWWNHSRIEFFLV